MNEQTIASKKENPLGFAPVLGLIGKFAIPSIISMLVMAAYNITDQIFIGHVEGMLGNAATNVAFPTVTLTTAFAQMVGIGTAANFNIHMGAKEEEEAKRYIGTGLTMLGVLGIFVMCAVLLLKQPILRLCGATDAVMPLALSYLGITAIGLPFHLFSNAGSHLIRADGSPAYSMFCTVTGAVLNVFLDALYMFGFHWGIRGAALATITGQFLSFLLCALYFPRMKSFSFSLKMLGIKWNYLIKIAKLGTSNFINQIIMMIVNITLNNMLSKYGAQSVYGSNLGAENYGRVKETYKKALALAVCIGLAAFAAFQLFPRQIVSIFGSGDALYYEFAEKYMRIYLMLVFAQTVQPLSVNYFTGIGNVKQGILISLSRQGFLLLPMLVIFPMLFGIDGILYAGPVSDAVACVLSLSLVFHNFRGMGKKPQKAAG